MTPPTPTGSSFATGVSAPVRPTWISIVAHHRGGLLGREFVRHRPARASRHEAQPLLPVEPVDLVDDAVDVVVERAAREPDLLVHLEQLLGRLATLKIGLVWKPALPSHFTMPDCVSAGISLICPHA